jgi:uncharacterized protein (UPF0548 family)
MISLRRPSIEAVRAFHDAQSNLRFSYSAIGATATTPPAGYDVDHTRIELGSGEDIFARARDAINRWEQFRLGWMEAWSPEGPRTGNIVVLIVHKMGLWWLNACRVVYVVAEEGPVERFGFAYGTLPSHAESGEERFLVEWDRQSGVVWYDILAFSRPGSPLIRLAYPYMRRVQKQFGRESTRAMLRAVRSGADDRRVVAGGR